MIRTTFSALQSDQQKFDSSGTIGNLISLHVHTSIKYLQAWRLHHFTSLGRLFQCLTMLSVRKFFQKVQSKLPLVQLVPFPCILSVVT